MSPAATVTFTPDQRSRQSSGARNVPVPVVAPKKKASVLALVIFIACLGMGATVGLSLISETHSEFVARGGVNMFIGNLTALVGTYLALIMVLVVSRLSFVETVLGQDRLVRLHKTLSPWPISLIALHVFFTTIGYAQAAKTGFWHQFGTFISSFPNMLTATIGFILMMAIAAISIRAIRSRLRRETWWSIHLAMYLALALSFAHIIALGPAFVGHPLARALWIASWLGTAGVVLVYRFLLPVVRSLRYSLKVVEVKQENSEVSSIILKGTNLEKLRFKGGQFFSWRFLAPGIWWQAHPYSLSAMPKPPYLRLTVKNLGDHSGSLGSIKPGTRVLIEGPYGTLTAHSRQRQHALLIAGGIGVTALRALLEELPAKSKPVVIRRVRSQEDLVLKAEVEALIKHRRGNLYELIGSRRHIKFDGPAIQKMVPDILHRDVYICGSQSFVDGIIEIVKDIGVNSDSIHFEAFSI